ncbi:MAG: hypothetical protein ACI9EF_000190 [Pseudohongiellaceae bacterium]|jgi:uncharacterized protein involved in cysteine biosynthesis
MSDNPHSNADSAAPHSDRSGRTKAPATGHGAVRCWACGTALEAPSRCPRCKTDAPQPALRKGSAAFLARLGKGAAAPFRGLGFLNAHPKLWSWIMAPLVLNTIIFVGGAWFLIGHLSDWLPDFEQPWPDWIDWVRSSTSWLLSAVMWAVGVLASFIVTLLLSGVVNSPFYDFLSEKVEAAHFGVTDPGRPLSALLGDIIRSLRASISLLLRWGLVMLLLFLLSFTAIGAPLFAIAGCYYLGLAQVDLTMARKLYPGGLRASWARRHFPLIVGLGIPVSILPLLAPFAIVGATLAFLDEPDKR